ncbi:DUF1538 domain-containing protein [Virgibacillus pantothenticus]|uniref:DUF1538 domain-containing protein n=1 Tax=Virgibacillus pantothenticus TaxID=1473 RepID=A0A0L0QS65_VIRPA|nr:MULTISPECIES: DUF1538 domain-containing protein [Virgibacillus]API91971.1 hypothetical protein BKP57_09090 [Virgibacillus sp. 6R]KNE21397.1 hypothetical protein AFK71_06950 [Virgibacillus pantothenticus]MBS7430426.1 DUF1538 domain-containing protein [Virgibacillus sp. 19R1-5]MBU8566364.1 DUF1538 domain-containing protein [Virgibacillus pantothenticus]MBU8600220.1 DUF1538 domain-containing protein [Virgibacillus pantothenticus]
MDNIKETIIEVVQSILPITIVITVLQFTLIWLPTETFIQFLIGVLMVGIGLILFLLGVNIGMLPIGEMIGSALSKTKIIWLIVFFGFLLGAVVTIAEPDVRVLSTQVDQVSNGEISKTILILAVAIGVGIFVALSLMRIIFSIPITYILAGGYGMIFILAAFTPSTFVPISFDAGGVTTGPLTVPFIMALGVGVASVLRGKSASQDGFGLIALASLGPILSVLILGVIYG